MQPYANLSGTFGVVAFEITPRSITLRFEDGITYLYSDVRPGLGPRPRAIGGLSRVAAYTPA